MSEKKNSPTEIRALKLDEIEAVSGGGALQTAFSNVIKSIGQALQTTASKQ